MHIIVYEIPLEKWNTAQINFMNCQEAPELMRACQAGNPKQGVVAPERENG